MTSLTRRGHVIAFGVVVAVALALLIRRGAGLIDFQVYRLGGHTLLHGGDLYAATTSHHFLFTYPPCAAMVFAPLALLPFSIGQVLWTSINAAALVGFVRVHLPRLTSTDAQLIAVSLAAGCLEPIWQNFFLGQVNLVLALAISLDLLAPASRRGRGLLTGIAIGIKLTPAIFVPLLILVGHRKAARNAVLTFGATVAVAMVVAPAASGQYWFHDVLAAGRVGDQSFANNQSLLAATLRVLHTAAPPSSVTSIWLLLALLAGSAGIAVGRAWWRRGEPRLALAATGLGGLLASPVSWTHHWVWCLPLGAGLFVAGQRAGLHRLVSVALAAVWSVAFVVAPTLWVPRHLGRELEWTTAQSVAGDTYLWISVVALAILAHLAARTSVSRPAPGRLGHPLSDREDAATSPSREPRPRGCP